MLLISVARLELSELRHPECWLACDGWNDYGSRPNIQEFKTVGGSDGGLQSVSRLITLGLGGADMLLGPMDTC